MYEYCRRLYVLQYATLYPNVRRESIQAYFDSKGISVQPTGLNTLNFCRTNHHTLPGTSMVQSESPVSYLKHQLEEYST